MYGIHRTQLLKFIGTQEAADKKFGYIGRSDEIIEITKPAEGPLSIGKGKLLAKAKQTITTGVQKTKELSTDVFAAVKKDMPSFQEQQLIVKSFEATPDINVNNFRARHPTDYRTQDGHFVRSTYEQSLDNWFYSKRILHEYEKALTPPNEKWMCPDFYLPYDMDGKYIGNLPGGIFVEILGMTEDKDYKISMNKKQAIYAKKGMNLIELDKNDFKDLTSVLPKKFPMFYHENISPILERPDSMNTQTPYSEINKEKPTGHCIRCGATIKLDTNKPYCLKDYDKWKECDNKTYVEKNGKCHICGNPYASSMNKPLCSECFRKNKK